jgi:hypothetical protein
MENVALDRRQLECGATAAGREVAPLREEELHEELPRT